MSLSLLLLIFTNIFSFKIATTEDGLHLLHWEESTIPYYINNKGSDDIKDGSDFKNVIDSFSEWSFIPCSYINFSYQGKTYRNDVGFDPAASDNINLVTWVEKGWEYDSVYIAMTSVTYDESTGVIYDADIELNGENYTFSTSEVNVKTDIKNTLMHEIGHVLGLDHSKVKDAVMYSKAKSGELTKRVLSQDDMDALCYLYPVEGNPPWLMIDDSENTTCQVTLWGTSSISLSIFELFIFFFIIFLWKKLLY